MRIVLTTHAFYPHAVVGGGVARYVDSVARAFLARGHQVSILTARPGSHGTEPGARYEDTEWQGLPVRRLEFNLLLSPNVYRFEWDNPWANERILEFVQQQRADVVHAAHLGHLSMSCVPLLKQIGAVVVGQVHDYWFICPISTLKRVDESLCEGPDSLGGECVRCLIARPWTLQDRTAEMVKRAPALALKGVGLAASLMPNPVGRWASVKAQLGRLDDMRRFLLQMDAVVCPSRFVAELFRRNDLDLPNLHLLPYGIQLDSLAGAAAQRPPGPLRIGFLGRLGPTKGVHLLIEAVRSLPTHLSLELHLFGYEEVPEYVARLHSMAAGDPRVHFRGEVAHAGLALPELDVLVMPSVWYEVFPLVIREAHAAGVPVIASDLGGMKEGVHNEVDGLHFRTGDAADLARQLRRLLDEADLVPRLKAGIRRPLSTDEHAQALLDLYSSFRAPAASPGLPLSTHEHSRSIP